MRPELVIFDVDGLMLDTEARWQQAWQEVGLKHGIDDLGYTTFLRCVGRNGKEVEQIVYDDLKNDHPHPEMVLEEARIYGKKLLEEHIDPKPGIYELLNLLDELNIPKAVATATDRDLTIERLERLNLLHHFDYLLCGNEVTKRKPHPEIYQKVVQHFDIDNKKALVLEDSIVGVEAAFRANISCIMIPDLIAPQDTQKQQALAIVSSLHDVIELFD